MAPVQRRRFRGLALLLAVGPLGCSNADSGTRGQETLIPLDEAAAITRAYGEALQKMQTDGQVLFGASNLPEPKARIRAALFRMLASVSDRTDVEFLKAAVVRLAYFQDGIDGMAPLSATAPDGRRYREIVEAEVFELASELASRGYGAPPGKEADS
jgi:hypothetical protein